MYRRIWLSVVFRMGGHSPRRGPWWHFDMVLLTPNDVFQMGFTWNLHETTFLMALRRRLLALAVIADLGEAIA